MNRKVSWYALHKVSVLFYIRIITKFEEKIKQISEMVEDDISSILSVPDSNSESDSEIDPLGLTSKKYYN